MNTVNKDLAGILGNFVNRIAKFTKKKFPPRDPDHPIFPRFKDASIQQLLWHSPDVRSRAGELLTDTANWLLVSGWYTAEGNEDWITIGQFAGPRQRQLVDPAEADPSVAPAQETSAPL